MNDQMIHEHPDVEFETNIIDNNHESDGAPQTEEGRDESESIPLEYVQKMQRYEEMKNKQPLDREAPGPSKAGNSFSAKALASGKDRITEDSPKVWLR